MLPIFYFLEMKAQQLPVHTYLKTFRKPNSLDITFSHITLK